MPTASAKMQTMLPCVNAATINPAGAKQRGERDVADALAARDRSTGPTAP